MHGLDIPAFFGSVDLSSDNPATDGSLKRRKTGHASFVYSASPSTQSRGKDGIYESSSQSVNKAKANNQLRERGWNLDTGSPLDWEQYEAQDIGIGDAASNLLKDVSFVFCGQLSSMNQHSAEILIQRHGGTVEEDPDSSVKFAVIGKNPGEERVRRIKDEGIEVLDEQEFLKILEERIPSLPPINGFGNEPNPEITTHQRDTKTLVSLAYPMDDNLLLVEEQERGKILASIKRVHSHAELTFEAGLDNLSDNDLQNLLSTLDKYTIHAARHLEPEILRRLAAEGTDKALAARYSEACQVARRRGLDMSKHSVSGKASGLLKTSRRPLNDAIVHENIDMQTEHIRNSTNQPSTNQFGMERQEKDTSKVRDPHKTASVGENLQGRRGQFEETETYIPTQLPYKLPEDVDSPFWCRQCRKGPLLCMHSHRLIGNILKNLSCASPLDLLFCRHMLLFWKSYDQDRFGIESLYSQKARSGYLEWQRASWFASLNQYRKEGKMNQDALHAPLVEEKLKSSIKCYISRAKSLKPRYDVVPVEKQKGESIESWLSDSDTDDVSDHLQDRELIKDRDTGNIQRGFKKRPCDSGISVDSDRTSSVSEPMSVESRDSLFVSSEIALNQIMSVPRSHLDRLVSELSPQAPLQLVSDLLIKMAKEDRSIAKRIKIFLDEAEKSDEMSSHSPEDRSNHQLGTKSGSNLVDQIAGPGHIPNEVRCSRCEAAFDPSSPRLSNECRFHNEPLTRRNTQQVGKTMALKNLATEYFPCCQRSRSSAGCRSGKHQISHILDENTRKDKLISPLDTAESASVYKDQGRSLHTISREMSEETPIGSSVDGALDALNTPFQGVAQESISDFYPRFPDLPLQEFESIVRDVAGSENIRVPDFFKLESDSSFDKLHPSEIGLASLLQWDYSHFVLRKKQLFRACIEAHNLRTPFTITTFRQFVPGNSTADGVLYKLYQCLGLLERKQFQNLLAGASFTLPGAMLCKKPKTSQKSSEGPGIAARKSLSGRKEFYKNLFDSFDNSKSSSNLLKWIPAVTPAELSSKSQVLRVAPRLQHNSQAAIETLPSTGTPSKQKPAASDSHQTLPFPKSWKEAHTADEEMVRLKYQGKSWQDIYNAWKKHQVGTVSHQASLASRYAILKRRFKTEWDKEYAGVT